MFREHHEPNTTKATMLPTRKSPTARYNTQNAFKNWTDRQMKSKEDYTKNSNVVTYPTQT